MKPTIVDTARLTLRRMTDDDAESIYRLSLVASIIANTGDPALADVDAARAILRTRILSQYAHGLGRWAVVAKDGGAFLGWCGARLDVESNTCDLAFRFFEEHWGRGYATEAASAVIAYVRAQRPDARITATVALHNTSSMRVLEKVGLRLVRHDVDEDGPIAVYALPP